MARTEIRTRDDRINKVQRAVIGVQNRDSTVQIREGVAGWNDLDGDQPSIKAGAIEKDRQRRVDATREQLRRPWPQRLPKQLSTTTRRTPVHEALSRCHDETRSIGNDNGPRPNRQQRITQSSRRPIEHTRPIVIKVRHHHVTTVGAQPGILRRQNVAARQRDWFVPWRCKSNWRGPCQLETNHQRRDDARTPALAAVCSCCPPSAHGQSHRKLAPAQPAPVRGSNDTDLSLRCSVNAAGAPELPYCAADVQRGVVPR